MSRGLIFSLLFVFASVGYAKWGFFAHQKINYYAVFTLPNEMIGFFKYHIDYITTEAVKADKRRYADKDEAPRHYIDLELYPDPLDSIPFLYTQAEEKYSEDSIKSWGTLPWTILRVKYQLTEAMRTNNTSQVLSKAADLGHYLADAHVPLHTTENYNGQLTDQEGIHGFWESRLPEIYFDEYDLITGKAEYIQFPSKYVREIIRSSHDALDSVLVFEKELSSQVSADQKYSYEERGNRLVKVYSRSYAKRYHDKLNGMVERRLRSSIRAIGDFWYTCWIDAGQPELDLGEKEKSEKINPEINPDRQHESSSNG